jgi:hypothetical protein
MRIVLGTGALAVLSLVAPRIGPIVNGPAAAEIVADPVAAAAVTRRTTRVTHHIRYVRLRPGQRPPPGARVIREAAPTPRIVIDRIVMPQRTRVVTRSRQSGR